MGLTGSSKRGRAPGARRASRVGQLSRVASRLLVLLWQEQQRMAEGTPAEQEEVLNRGVPWDLQRYAEALGVPHAEALSHALRGMEKEARGLVWCLGTGTGRGRRISHVKLSGEAIQEVAQVWAEHGMSRHRLDRERARARAEWEAEELDRWYREQEP